MSFDYLKSAFYSQNHSPTFYLFLLIIAWVLGTVHALGPGHGKTVMVAYLSDVKFRWWNVITVVLALTISHVFSVLVLGLLALVLMNFFLPERVAPWFSLFSGGMLVALGLWLIVQRGRRLIQPSKNKGHDHHLRHVHQYQHGERYHFWQDLLTGVSGGIIPCPKAVIILLLAISVQQLLLGLSLILAFSLGIAFTLMMIGFTVQQSARWVESRFSPIPLEWISFVGAWVIFFLGLWMSFRLVKIMGWI